MSGSSRRWEKIGALLDRHANLNQLRVGTIQVYLVVVAAVLALLGGTDASARTHSFVIPLGICLVGVGLLVYLYDLRLRARTHAVAVEVARNVSDSDPDSATVESRRFDEDLFFSMVAMLVNSTLVYIGLEQGFVFEELNNASVAALAVGFFAAQILFYSWYWPRLARNLSAWPDGFAPRRPSAEEGAGGDEA